VRKHACSLLCLSVLFRMFTRHAAVLMFAAAQMSAPAPSCGLTQAVLLAQEYVPKGTHFCMALNPGGKVCGGLLTAHPMAGPSLTHARCRCISAVPLLQRSSIGSRHHRVALYYLLSRRQRRRCCRRFLCCLCWSRYVRACTSRRSEAIGCVIVSDSAPSFCLSLFLSLVACGAVHSNVGCGSVCCR
jgi:hypothetical protein